MQDKEYIVKFGIARSWNEEEDHQNTRIKTFTNKKLAWKCLKRLNKFKLKDRYVANFTVPAWTDMYSKNQS